MRIEWDNETEALHAAIMLSHLREKCSTNGIVWPYEDTLRQAQIDRHGMTKPDIRRVDSDNGRSDPPPFVTEAEAGRRLHKSERTIRRWVARGHITRTVAGIPRTELDRLKGRSHGRS